MEYQDKYHERLCQLLRVANSLTQEQVDICNWTPFFYDGEGEWVGCLSSHAGRDPWFQAQGFSLGYKEEDYSPSFSEGENVYGGWDSLKKFFKLDLGEIRYVFDPDSYEEMDFVVLETGKEIVSLTVIRERLVTLITDIYGADTAKTPGICLENKFFSL